MDKKSKDFLKWMFTPSAVHSTLMEHDDDFRNDFRKRILDRQMEVFKDKESADANK